MFSPDGGPGRYEVGDQAKLAGTLREHINT
jgi:hypothetical protein